MANKDKMHDMILIIKQLKK